MIQWMSVDRLGLVVAGVAFCVSLFAAWTGLSVAKRQARELGWILLNDLTSGEVAAARHRVGTFMYGPTGRPDLTETTMVRDYYTLLWCIERASSGHQALRGWTAKTAFNDFRGKVRWHAQEIATNISLLHAVFSGYDDEAAWDAFLASAGVLGFEEMTGIGLREEIRARKLPERRAALADDESEQNKRRRWF